MATPVIPVAGSSVNPGRRRGSDAIPGGTRVHADDCWSAWPRTQAGRRGFACRFLLTPTS